MDTKKSEPTNNEQKSELTNDELEGVVGGRMIIPGTQLLPSLNSLTSPTLTKTAEAADPNSDQSPLF